VILDAKTALRLQFLVRVAGRECEHLALTDRRIFEQPFTVDRARELAVDFDLAEKVEAFVGRFARLQDTLGDKLLPLLLAALGEKTGAAIDNLDIAERFGWIPSTDQWLAMRKLRNQMIHEYIEDPVLLASALSSGHLFVETLSAAAMTMIAEVKRRAWA
jgi:hypothetical protein